MTRDPANVPDYLAFDPCAYCGRVGDYYRPVVGADHIVPLSVGGEDNWTNLTACCHSCNSSKRADPLLSALLRMRQTAGYRTRDLALRPAPEPPEPLPARRQVGSPTMRRWLARQGRDVAPWRRLA